MFGVVSFAGEPEASSGSRIPRSECANLVVRFESVAQLVEHRPFKALVLGSSPSALTIKTPIKTRALEITTKTQLKEPLGKLIQK